MTDEDPGLREIRRTQERARAIQAMSVDVKKYLSLYHHLCNEATLIFPYEPVVNGTGRITRLRPDCGSVDIVGDGRLDWTEKSEVTRDGRIRFVEYGYHFQPKDGRGLYSFRIDMDPGDPEGHVNPAPELRAKIGNHLRFTDGGTKVEIVAFNLLLATAVALQYVDTGEYPFMSGVENKYNRRIQKLRKQVEP